MAAVQTRVWQAQLRRLTGLPPRWWQEALVLGAGFAAYSGVQDAMNSQPVAALSRGRALWHAEGSWGLRPELALNRWLVAHHDFAVVADYYYVVLHLGATAAVLFWLYHRRPTFYRRARGVLVLASLLALVVFWLAPVAPPRLLAHTGLFDTVPALHTWGAYESGSLKAHADLLASMPSLHFGWALWCGVALARLGRGRALRAVGVAYPVLTALDVLATANHYWLDLLGGAAVVGLAFAVQRVLTGEWLGAGARAAAEAPPRMATREVVRLPAQGR